MMKITDIPEFRDKGNVLTFEPNTPVVDAVCEMSNRNYGCAVILEDNKIAGIFTERDLLHISGKGKDLTTLTLKDVMVKNVKTARETDEVLTSLRRMSQGRFRHLPVVDAAGNLLGILSQGDFVALTWGKLFTQLGHTAKASFLSKTQIWLLVASVLVYLTIMLYMMKYFN